jgi:hypothetical protein
MFQIYVSLLQFQYYLLADTARMKCAATTGRQENSTHMCLTNFCTLPLERRNKQSSPESETEQANEA